MNYEKFLLWLKKAFKHGLYGALVGFVIGCIILPFLRSQDAWTIVPLGMFIGSTLFVPEFIISIWFIALHMLGQLSKAIKE